MRPNWYGSYAIVINDFRQRQIVLMRGKSPKKPTDAIPSAFEDVSGLQNLPNHRQKHRANIHVTKPRHLFFYFLGGCPFLAGCSATRSRTSFTTGERVSFWHASLRERLSSPFSVCKHSRSCARARAGTPWIRRQTKLVRKRPTLTALWRVAFDRKNKQAPSRKWKIRPHDKRVPLHLPAALLHWPS